MERPLPRVVIYTDGGCDPNPGPGGWGAVLIFGHQTREISGAHPATTNNRMELTAAIQALRVLQRPCDIVLYTDSEYLRRGITEWLPGWRRRRWRTRDGRPVKNQDLWQELAAALEEHRIDWRWVKGHGGDPLNQRADRLAAEARRRLLAGPTSDAGPGGQLAADRVSLPQVEIYARGCALGSPGPGGYAAILVRGADEQDEDVSGAWPLATSNVMELWAAVSGLQALEELSQVTLHTASKYVLDGATRWLSGWERQGWRKRDGRLVKNKDIWVELVRAMGDHDVAWRPLSERGDPHARRAAKLARAQAEEMKASQSRRKT